MNTLDLSKRDQEALDQPIWSALNSKQRSLALGSRLALRYPSTIASFAAVSELTPEAVSDLAALATDGPVALLSSTPLSTLDGFVVEREMILGQMVWAGSAADASDFSPDMLGANDVPAMLELTALTKPGPFFPQTYQMGRYIGIRDGDRLAAMAGERMRFDGFTEISAVCVHPDYRRKGYAQTLVKNLIHSNFVGGNVPFLHVHEGNAGAITLYKRLGFVMRTKLHLTVMHRSDVIL